MIADDRGSQIAKCSPIIWKHTSAIVCDQLRSSDHMETQVLRSAIETYPIIFWIPTHDSTLYSNKATAYLKLRMVVISKRNSKSVDFKKSKYPCSKISSSTSAILFAAIFSLAQFECHFDTSAVRNDRLRSSAIIWKPFSLRSSAICDLRSMENSL